jgi:carboxyl-terminal processing protease
MNRRFQLGVVAFSTGLVALLLVGAVHGGGATADSPITHIGVYSEVLSRIQSQYVEEPDMKAVTLGGITGMLEAIDPYASYLNADQYKQYLASRQKTQAGTGLLLSKRYGYMAIVDSVPGSPAAKAGLSTNDIIESINNVATRDMPLAFADILLQGDPGTTVEMSVLRTIRSDPQKIVLTRAAIDVPPVTSRLITDQGDSIGLISTVSVDAGRVRDIAQRIADLDRQGAKRFILDVRHSVTGSPEDGVALANLFMDKGLIGYSVGQKSPRQDYQAVASKAVTKKPLVVLTNRATSGGAEVAAAALLESKRAQVVGERTYGDAAIRKAVNLDDGSAIILSIAKFYGPDGKAIQDTAVMPSTPQIEAEVAADIDVDSTDAPPPPPKNGPDLILQKGEEVVRKATAAN